MPMTHLLALLLACTASAYAEVPKKAMKLALADDHNCALFEDGTVKCWGANDQGQLGLGNTSQHGAQPGTMSDSLPFAVLGNGVKVVDLKANGLFTCALLSSGDLKCWGANDSGQLGQGDTNPRGNQAGTIGEQLKTVDLGKNRKVVSFAVGFDHACAILDNHDLKCWGANNGELGLGDTRSRGIKAGEMGDALSAINLGLKRYAVQVTAGYGHTCAILDNSAVKCWGDGSSGQLGQENTNVLGDAPLEMGDVLKAIDLGTNLKPYQVFAASTHTCVLFEDRSVKCFGDNSNGSTGAGDGDAHGDQPGEMGTALPFLELENGLTVDQMSCARRHCCVVFAGPGTMKCWGINDNAQLGLGDVLDRGSAKDQMGQNLPFTDVGRLESVRSVSTSRYGTCVIMADGAVKCWGLNSSGQLGLGDLETRGDIATEMGDGLPRVPLF
jgi:alpha-tubulin suppressor-like RCC1 family protein